MPKKILIADDDQGIRETTKTRLEANGYEVIVASDGQEALDLLSKEGADLIILDILMPGMDGYTFVKGVRGDAALKDIPIIILSGKDRMKDLFEMEGIKDYIVKPFKAPELLATIAKHLRGSE